jgi:predicted TIM-barrel fold metal-dependent hydrolase
MDQGADRPRAVIDADIHNVVPSIEALFPYLTDHWREYISQSAFKGPVETPYPEGAATSIRPDLRAAGMKQPGSTLAQVREQVLDRFDLACGILNCAYGIESIHNPDAAAALASAVNDWQIAEWLDKEPRLRASLVVPSQQPAMAAREIARVGGHPGFVQVYLPVRSYVPYGNRQHHPIYEAALRHDLAIGLHFGGATGTPPTPVGWPSYYLEEYAGMTQVFQSQLTSLIVEGAFDTFPDLRVACIESGWTWLPAHFWRIDKEWKGLRREVPWVRRAPSEYIREHVRFTLQPCDAPPDPRRLLQLFEQLESPDLVMFSTDFPHWHATPDADTAFADALPEPLRHKLLTGNARTFYRL